MLRVFKVLKAVLGDLDPQMPVASSNSEMHPKLISL